MKTTKPLDRIPGIETLERQYLAVDPVKALLDPAGHARELKLRQLRDENRKLRAQHASHKR